MSNNNEWDKYFEESQRTFSETDIAKKATSRMFDSVMGSIAKPDETTPLFSDARQMVETIADTPSLKKNSVSPTPPTKSPIRPRKQAKKVNRLPAMMSGLAAVAALFIIVLNTNKAPKPAVMNDIAFNPPLSVDDMPVAMINPDNELRTIATNNSFYLGYLENNNQKSAFDLVVHSRSGKVEWNKLFVVDEDNDLVTPLNIDEINGAVSLPLSELDMTLEVADDKGNMIECTLPSNLERPEFSLL